MNRCIGVIGGNSVEPEIEVLATQVGEEIAKAGFALICGGRQGVMAAVCRGAKKAGGLTIGVLPGDSRQEANAYVDVAIVTGMGAGRNIIVVKSSEVIIAIDGKFGTLSEIAFALQLGIPVIGLRTWEISQEIQVAQTASEAVEMAVKIIADKNRKRRHKWMFWQKH